MRYTCLIAVVRDVELHVAARGVGDDDEFVDAVMDGVDAASKMIGPTIRRDDERPLADDKRSSKGGKPE